MSSQFEKYVRARARRFGHNLARDKHSGEWNCEDLMHRPINAHGSLEQVNAFLDYLETHEPWRDTGQYEQPSAEIVMLPGVQCDA